MLPLAPIVARAGWVALGVVAGVVAKSAMGKEAVDMFKDGVTGMCEAHRNDAAAKARANMTDKERRDLQEKEQLVKDIKAGKQ